MTKTKKTKSDVLLGKAPGMYSRCGKCGAKKFINGKCKLCGFQIVVPKKKSEQPEQ